MGRPAGRRHAIWSNHAPHRHHWRRYHRRRPPTSCAVTTFPSTTASAIPRWKPPTPTAASCRPATPRSGTAPPPCSGLRWLGRSNAPLLLNPRFSWHKYSWLLQFMRQIPNHRRNTIATTRLAIEARQHLLTTWPRPKTSTSTWSGAASCTSTTTPPASRPRDAATSCCAKAAWNARSRPRRLATSSRRCKRPATPASTRRPTPPATSTSSRSFEAARGAQRAAARRRPGTLRGHARGGSRHRAGAANGLPRRLHAVRRHRRHPQVHARAGPGLRATGRALRAGRRRRRDRGRRRGLRAEPGRHGRRRRPAPGRRRGGLRRRGQPTLRAAAGRHGQHLSGQGLFDQRAPGRRRQPRAAPRVSLLDEAAKIVTSRLGDRFRVAGTAEFNGYNLDIRAERVQPLVDWTRRHFPGVRTARVVPW